LYLLSELFILSLIAMNFLSKSLLCILFLSVIILPFDDIYPQTRQLLYPAGYINTWDNIGFIKGKDNTNIANDYYFDDVIQCGSYKYRLKQIDYNGNFNYYNLEDKVTILNPFQFELSLIHPNPFNSSVKIDYKILIETPVVLMLYDLSGRVAKKYLTNFENPDIIRKSSMRHNSQAVYISAVLKLGNSQKYNN